VAGVAGSEVHDRLCQQHEPVVVERFPDPLRPCAATLRLGAPGVSGCVELGAVTAGVLGVVHREVRVDEHVLAAQVLPRIRTARSQRWPRVTAGVRRARLSLPAAIRAAVGHEARFARVGVLEQHRELVAAEAGEPVGLA
jgi:hypothetical protein